MPRKGKVPKRDILPDPKFHSKLVSKFVHGIMWEGKKSTAETILYDALEIVGKKLNEEPLKIFERAVENVKPVLEVRSHALVEALTRCGRDSPRKASGLGDTLDYTVCPFAF